MLSGNVREASRSDRKTGCRVDGRERHSSALALPFNRGLDELAQVRFALKPSRQMTPDLFDAADFGEPGAVLNGQRLESYVAALQRTRFNIHACAPGLASVAPG